VYRVINHRAIASSSLPRPDAGANIRVANSPSRHPGECRDPVTLAVQMFWYCEMKAELSLAFGERATSLCVAKEK
jgi:hypothetical protein